MDAVEQGEIPESAIESPRSKVFARLKRQLNQDNKNSMPLSPLTKISLPLNVYDKHSH
jgi:hypothetical protein